MRDDKELVLKSVCQNGYALEYASSRLRNDENIVLEAIKEISFALNYASEKLKDDKLFIKKAMKEKPFSLEYASDRLKCDKDLLEILESSDKIIKNEKFQVWYEEKMEVLANIREKEKIDSSVIKSNKKSTKIKF